ncbi:DUF1616 domain-containing protein [Candidatus Bathyarchaeota archaeon]|jgi:uncharacterized membrane protein|nr:DUF1616 domain-containing protein [Candidatus Bathyarchaeota archaeon]MBT6605429.1 DUF1616 domain-containing protein [Candidatus Bathyarchaeota archaeon]MBT7186916.1 DUF1616 domain-containing protein [Candidatus Bathyarchaeota archaeon]MBT7913295.1 DUF1616 domain-containing protein [Candidatus Bathyarchaeota archaeon]
MIDEALKTVIVGLLLVIAGFTVFQTFFADRLVEPFSELGILGPNMKIGDYPRELAVGEDFDLFLYMRNHMGSPQMYRVYVKLGDRGLNVSDTLAYPAPVVTSYQYSLGDKQNVTLPITLNVPEAGVNSRLVFEMHRFDVEVGEFVYHERWNQLWLNMTEVG